MDRFNVENGGMPLYGDDFLFIQESYTSVIKAIASSIGVTSYILSGVEYTIPPLSPQGTEVDVSAGWVVIDGEPFYFAGGTYYVGGLVPLGGGAAQPNYIKIEETNDPAGLAVYADSVSKPKYVNRRVVMSTGTGDVLIDELPRYVEVLKDITKSNAIVYTSQVLLEAPHDGFAKFSREGNIVQFSAEVSKGLTGSAICSCPEIMKPLTDRQFVVAVRDTPFWCVLHINATGIISLQAVPQIDLDASTVYVDVSYMV